MATALPMRGSSSLLSKSKSSGSLNRSSSSGSLLLTRSSSSQQLHAKRLVALGATQRPGGRQAHASTTPAASDTSDVSGSVSRSKVTAHVAALEALPDLMDAPPAPRSPMSDMLIGSLSDMTSGKLTRLPPRARPQQQARVQRALQEQREQQRGRRAAAPSDEDVLFEILSGFENDYAVGELLGKGTFGEVRVATHVATGRQCAVKVLNKRVGDADVREAVVEEVRGCDAPGLGGGMRQR